MRAPLHIRAGITLMSAVAFCAGLLLTLIGLLFVDNFSLINNAHLGILLATFGAPFLVVSCWIYFQLRPCNLSAALTFLSYIVTAMAWFLWTAPAARGLVH